jgi:hypothetical protein
MDRADNGDSDAIHHRSGGEVTLWIEQGTSIQLKAVTPHGDPVELSADEAEELGRLLLQLAEQIR